MLDGKPVQFVLAVFINNIINCMFLRVMNLITCLCAGFAGTATAHGGQMYVFIHLWLPFGSHTRRNTKKRRTNEIPQTSWNNNVRRMCLCWLACECGYSDVIKPQFAQQLDWARAQRTRRWGGHCRLYSYREFLFFYRAYRDR